MRSLKTSNKILIVSSEFPPGPGGIGNHAYSMAKSLRELGYHIFVVTDADFAKKEDVVKFDQENSNLNITRVWRQGFKTYLNRIKNVANLVKKEKVDIVIYSGKFSLWIGGILSLQRRAYKALAVLHGSEVKMSNTLLRGFTNWCIGTMHFLIPVSQFTYELLNKKLQHKPYEIIENGIDLEEMALLNKQPIIDKETFFGTPALLTVGNVTRRKGQHRVIKALPELIKKFPALHYHIVGLPSNKEEFQQLAESLSVEKYVSFHGRLPKREDLGVAYNSVDCFVILSENQPDGDVEGFGIVILEANYFGLPAIGATGCGIADAIKEGYNGFLVDGDNSYEISNALCKVLKEQNKMGINAKEWSKEHDWMNIAKKYQNIISSLTA